MHARRTPKFQRSSSQPHGQTAISLFAVVCMGFIHTVVVVVGWTISILCGLTPYGVCGGFKIYVASCSTTEILVACRSTYNVELCCSVMDFITPDSDNFLVFCRESCLLISLAVLSNQCTAVLSFGRSLWFSFLREQLSL